MKADVTIFGGFRGLPDPLTADDRDITLFETILSWDLLGNDPVRNDNSDSVVNGGVATGTVAILAYAFANIPNSIWRGTPWSITLKFAVDGIIYGLVTAGAFGWLWPAAAATARIPHL